MVKSFLKEATDSGWLDGYKEQYRGRAANPRLVETSLALRAAIQAMVEDGEFQNLTAELSKAGREIDSEQIAQFEQMLTKSVLSGGVMEMKTVDLIIGAPDTVLRDALLYMVYCDPSVINDGGN